MTKPKKKDSKWLSKLDMKKGALTEKAKKAGKTVAQYAEDVTKPGSKASPTTKKQANLAKTLHRISRRRKKK